LEELSGSNIRQTTKTSITKNYFVSVESKGYVMEIGDLFRNAIAGGQGQSEGEREFEEYRNREYRNRNNDRKYRNRDDEREYDDNDRDENREYRDYDREYRNRDDDDDEDDDDD
jgi:hypothetical protein